MNCIECGLDISKESGREAYAHALTCFHLEDKGIKQLRNENMTEAEPRKGRIDAVLDYASSLERAEVTEIRRD